MKQLNGVFMVQGMKCEHMTREGSMRDHLFKLHNIQDKDGSHTDLKIVKQDRETGGWEKRGWFY